MGSSKYSSDRIESDTVCLFENSDNSLEVVQSLTALANTEGGFLLVGVKKNGKICGVLPGIERNTLIEIIGKHSSPDFVYSVIEIQEGVRLYIEVHVDKSLNSPIYFKNKSNSEIYIRRNCKTIKANKIIENILRFKNINGNKPNELSIDEFNIVELIRNEKEISLTQLHKKSNLPINVVDYILVRLVTWGIIDLNFIDTNCLFKIVE